MEQHLREAVQLIVLRAQKPVVKTNKQTKWTLKKGCLLHALFLGKRGCSCRFKNGFPPAVCWVLLFCWLHLFFLMLTACLSSVFYIKQETSDAITEVCLFDWYCCKDFKETCTERRHSCLEVLHDMGSLQQLQTPRSGRKAYIHWEHHAQGSLQTTHL